MINDFQNIGLIPPQDINLEKAVLGMTTLEPNIAIEFGKQLKPDLFFKENHRIICTAIQELIKDARPVDILSLTRKLVEKNELENIGGAYALSELTQRIASTVNFEYYLKLLQQLQMRRDTIEACTKAIKKAYDDSNDPLDTISELGNIFDSKLESFSDRKSLSSHELANQTVTSINKRVYNREIGVQTGFKALDSCLGGLVKNRLFILGARPAMGKTGLMLNIACNVAEKNNPVLIFSLEMDNEQLMNRILSQKTSIPSTSIDKLELTDEDLKKLDEASKEIGQLPIYFDDTPAITLSHVRAKSKQIQMKYGLEAIFIDYLQLMKPEFYRKNSNQTELIGEISKGLKILSKELKVPIIALSQLSREVEKRQDKEPVLSDLRDSGNIEQDSDVVMFLYRPEYYDDPTGKFVQTKMGEYPMEGMAVLTVAKNRHGPTRRLHLNFKKELVQFSDLKNIYQPLQPKKSPF